MQGVSVSRVAVLVQVSVHVLQACLGQECSAEHPKGRRQLCATQRCPPGAPHGDTPSASCAPGNSPSLAPQGSWAPRGCPELHEDTRGPRSKGHPLKSCPNYQGTLNAQAKSVRHRGTCHTVITSSMLYIALPLYTYTDIYLFMLLQGGCQGEGERTGRACVGRWEGEVCKACKVWVLCMV